MAVDMVRELSDPVRDYKKFDYKKRAHELFFALDEDSSGGITETEYVRHSDTLSQGYINNHITNQKPPL